MNGLFSRGRHFDFPVLSISVRDNINNGSVPVKRDCVPLLTADWTSRASASQNVQRRIVMNQYGLSSGREGGSILYSKIKGLKKLEKTTLNVF